MSQVSKHQLSKEIYDEIFATFLQTIANLKTKNDVLNFFNEFLTPTERIMFSKRLAAGLLIAEGYYYKEISSLLKTSTTTISTSSLLYKYGDNYKKVIDEIKRDKQVVEFLRNIGEKISTLGSIGGKGSSSWRVVNKELKNKKSKLL